MPADSVLDAPSITESLSPERSGFSRSKAEKCPQNLAQKGSVKEGCSHDIHRIGCDSHHKECGF